MSENKSVSDLVLSYATLRYVLRSLGVQIQPMALDFSSNSPMFTAADIVGLFPLINCPNEDSMYIRRAIEIAKQFSNKGQRNGWLEMTNEGRFARVCVVILALAAPL
jgi:hypothetical protein